MTTPWKCPIMCIVGWWKADLYQSLGVCASSWMVDGSLDTKGCELKIFIHPGPGWGHLTAYSQRKD